MERIALAFDRRLKEHDTGPHNPERPARLDAVRSALEWHSLLATSLRVESKPAERDVLERLHASEYIDRFERACRDGAAIIDEPDCTICPSSFELAHLSAGLVIEAARLIGGGEVRRAFCAVRPPGHHAERNRAMGFCFFANVGLAATVFRQEFDLDRVAILDWDVHHGNGTQHLFESDPSVLFISLHEHPDHQYPGTGYAHETGVGEGEGATLNIPFLPGAGDAQYRAAFDQQVLPRIDEFQPQAIILSNGLDAHADDPLGHLKLTDECYVWMTRKVLAAAERHASGRLLSVLEGGYDLGVLKRCVGDHVRILHEE